MSSIPFDIELAKAGHKVETADGSEVEILKFDRKDVNGEFPIVAIVKWMNAFEYVELYTAEGAYTLNGTDKEKDLRMVYNKKDYKLRVYKLDNERLVTAWCIQGEETKFQLPPGPLVAEFTFRA